MEFFAPMMILIVLFLVIGSIFRSRFVNKRLTANGQAFAELQSRLIDKYDDAGQVIAYLQSDAGRRLLEGDETRRGTAPARILDAVQTGILAMLGGLGLMAASGVSNPEVGEVMRTLGLVAILLGAGFLISAAVSRFLLKRWGLLPDAPDERSADEIV